MSPFVSDQVDVQDVPTWQGSGQGNMEAVPRSLGHPEMQLSAFGDMDFHDGIMSLQQSKQGDPSIEP